MSTLEIRGLTADVSGKQILDGIDLTVSSGEVHAVLGPTGAGKSTLSGVLAGHPSYTVTGGTATLDGVDLLALPAWERAKAGLFLAMQYPVEVPGVRLEEMLVESAVAAGRDPVEVRRTIDAEAANIGFEARFLDRPLNVGETAMVEYTFTFSGVTDLEFGTYAANRMSHVSVWARFTADRTPRRAWQFTQLPGGDPPQVAEVDATSLRSLHYALRAFGPGLMGLRWEW